MAIVSSILCGLLMASQSSAENLRVDWTLTEFLALSDPKQHEILERVRNGLFRHAISIERFQVALCVDEKFNTSTVVAPSDLVFAILDSSSGELSDHTLIRASIGQAVFDSCFAY